MNRAWRKSLRILLLLSATVLSDFVMAATLKEGEASGTMLVDGKPIDLHYAYARQMDKPELAGHVLLLLLEKPLPSAITTEASVYEVIEHRIGMEPGNITGILLAMSNEPVVWEIRFFGPKVPGFPAYPILSGTKIADSKLVHFDAKALDGHITMKAENYNNHMYGCDVDFSTAVIPTETIAPGAGKPLPSGGGDPGKAYLAFQKALQSPAPDQLKPFFTPEGLQEIEAERMISGEFPAPIIKLQITSGTILENHATLVFKGAKRNQFPPNDEFNIVGYVNLRVEGTRWKISHEDWEKEQ